jgi:hypothetical protein
LVRFARSVGRRNPRENWQLTYRNFEFGASQTKRDAGRRAICVASRLFLSLWLDARRHTRSTGRLAGPSAHWRSRFGVRPSPMLHLRLRTAASRSLGISIRRSLQALLVKRLSVS